MKAGGYVVKFRGQECRFGDLEAPRTVVTLVGAGEGEVFMERRDAERAAGCGGLEQVFVTIEEVADGFQIADFKFQIGEEKR
jgi:hypothetical protein